MAENDVFSALNVGSGLNTTELIKNLVDAEKAPKEEKINEKIETTEVSISAIADLKNLGTIIDVASTRGAFRAGEMATVGAMYNKLQAFITKVAPADKAQPTAGTTAPAETK